MTWVTHAASLVQTRYRFLLQPVVQSPFCD
jgi:hypothetical protein